MNSSIRVGLIGCGGRGREHAEGLVGSGKCEVVALSDVNRTAAEELAAQYEYKAEIYSDYRDLLEKSRPDLVIACLWTPLHLPVFEACVQAGVSAVHSEKPMAPTWGDCRKMAELAETSATQLTFCHQRRFAFGNLQVRRWINDGLLGEVQRMELYSPPNLLDCGTHTFDQAASFNSDLPAKWVLAAVDASEPIRWFDVSAELMAVGQVVYANGVRASFQVGGPDMDLWGGVRVTGTEGYVEANWDGLITHSAIYRDPTWRPDLNVPEGYSDIREMLSEIVESLETGKKSQVSHRYALRASEIIFAAYESVRRNARVELPLTNIEDNAFISMLETGKFADSST